MENYTPPFELTNEMLDKVSNIMEKIGKIDNFNYLDKNPYLRKQTKINSIHSSLAIENNKLSLNQVKDIINGKTVIGHQKDIQEIKNAYKAYGLLNQINPYSIDDLKRVHGIMTFLTVDDSGKFRTGPEGVFDGDNCIFICPPEDMVNPLMNNLFTWLNKNKDIIHPLILSSIFHYEFVFIHPFSDGNGRMARLWQNALLYNWKNVFEYIPIESKIHKFQSEYYAAIANCNNNGNSNEFITFMLKMIDDILEELIDTVSIPITNEDINIKKLLVVMKDTLLSANEIMDKLNIKSKETLRNMYLDPAIKKGLINLTIPDKPTSKNQKYYKI